MPSDIFKIKKLYPDSLRNPMSWHLSDILDHRMEISGNLSQIIKHIDQNTFEFEDGNDKGRLLITTTSSYYDSLVEKDHSLCLTRGYMMASTDWRNFEATVYAFITANSNDAFWIRGRGGKHASSGADCEGFSYTGVISFDGSVYVGKEQFHEHVLYTDPLDVTGSILDNWIGIKFVVYDDIKNTDNDRYNVPVVLEIWLDTSLNNNWQQVYHYRDIQGWGSSGLFCNAPTEDQKGLWGGPIVEFGWDNCENVKLKFMSVREIDPFGVFAEGGALPVEAIGVGGSGRSGNVISKSKSLVREVGNILVEGTGVSI